MKVTKRQLIAGGIATFGGVSAVALTSQPARGETLDIDDLTVDDISHDSPDGNIQDVSVTVSADYAFEATTDVDTLRLSLRAGRSTDSTSEIATETIDISGQSDSGTVELTGPLTYSSGFDIADFRPSDAGEQTKNTAWFILEAELRDSYGQTIASAQTQDGAEILVTQDEDVLSFSVGGSGEITIEG